MDTGLLFPERTNESCSSYKSLVEQNKQTGKEIDDGVNMGLFTYPILMASDILLFQSDIVPVGKDQVQHVEIARDIAEHFNKNYGETFKLPNFQIDEDTAVLPGLDGRKMSKSYNNTIPLFEEPGTLNKLIKKSKQTQLLHRNRKTQINQRSSLFIKNLLHIMIKYNR